MEPRQGSAGKGADNRPHDPDVAFHNTNNTARLFLMQEQNAFFVPVK